MTDDWKTLRVPKDAYEEAKAQKEEEGRTWGEQIVRPVEGESTVGDMAVEELQKVVENVSNSGGVDLEQIAEDRQRQLEEMFGAYCSDTATKEDIGDLADLIRDIDGGSSTVELDASERSKIAREVAEALQ